jgi:hypothetical protein
MGWTSSLSQTVPGQSERVFYGGTTADEINDRQNDRIGLQHWAREGIAGRCFSFPNICFPTHSKSRLIGRGVLIDYATWAEKKGIKYSTFSTHQVRLTDIRKLPKRVTSLSKRVIFFLSASGSPKSGTRL